MQGPGDILLEGQFGDSADPILLRLRTPELQRLLKDWRQRGETRRALPRRDDFSPEELRYMLGHVVLFDVVGRPARYRYRLYGSHFTFSRGFDLTGKFIDEHPNPDFSTRAIASLDHACRLCLPIFGAGLITQADGRLHHIETLALPLAEDGAAPDVVLVGQYDYEILVPSLPMRVAISDPLLLRPMIGHPLLRQLFDEWQGAGSAGRLPGRKDFPPERLKPWLGRVLLLERGPDSTRLRYRLIGSHLTEARGFDLTGRYLDEHPDPDFGAAIDWFCDEALRQARPAWYRGDGYSPRGLSLQFEGIVLPLASDGVACDTLMVLQLPHDAAA